MKNPLRRRPPGAGTAKFNSSKCYKCHKTGHIARECTSSEQSNGYRQKANDGNRYVGGRSNDSKSSPKDYSEDSNDSGESQPNILNEEDSAEAKSEDEIESESDSESESESEEVKEDLKEAKSEDESESESDSESDTDNEDEDDEFDHKWEEQRNEAPDTDEITCRIAVCNMDWDRIRAVDLLVCFNSFKPADGIVHSVKIYPSEFGLKRMEEEKLKGPPELVEETLPLDQEEIQDKKNSQYHREKLRQYQLNRLKYYYAVVECDSPETANSIYEQLNGMEYESSSVRFDLRFIPDDMTFDQKPTSVAEKVPSDYKPRLFVTSALQQVKVNLTWDETDPKRTEFFQKIFTDIDSVQDDIKDYLASASSESESEDEVDTANDDDSDKKLKTKDRIAKYKELLKSIEEKEKKEQEEKIDMEVTWEPDLKSKTEEKVKEKIKKDSLNPFEEMLLKKKEQKKLKKKELKKEKQNEDSEDTSEKEELSEALVNEKSQKDKKMAELALIADYKNETESADTLSLKKKKKKKDKSDDLDGFVADMNDPRFSAMHTSSLFNMAASEHHTKKNDGSTGLKRPKEKNFKHNGFKKGNKKARHH